jgi:spartin
MVVARPEGEDLRGQFIPMNDGEIVKMLDRSGRVHHEDRSLAEKLEGRERRVPVPVAVAVELWNTPNDPSPSTTSEAHILVTLPNATLTSSSLSPGGSGSGIGTTLTGQLTLEYVTFDIPRTATAAVPQGVLLVLVLRSGTGNNVACEEPLDPSRTLTVSSVLPSGARRYVFHATRDDAEFTVELPVVTDDVELFHSVLEGYVADLRVHGELQHSQSARGFVEESAAGSEGEDLRGRFVLMNEDDGEIVGTLDNSVRVHEDQSLAEKGRERDPVVVELPEGADTVDGLRDEEVLVRTIPPENRDWMLKGAVFVW